MARRRKRRGDEQARDPVPERAPERLARPFAEALRGLGERRAEERPAGDAGAEAAGDAAPGSAPAPARRDAPAPGVAAEPGGGAAPAPRPAHAWADRVAWNQAALGVRPLGGPKGRGPGGPRPRPGAAPPAPAPEPAEDAAARARLAALVAGGLRFRLDREGDGRLSALRDDADPGALRALRGGRATAEAELDLHGLGADEAETRAVAFLRRAHGRGLRVVRIVTGRGLHSDGGVPVLRGRVVHALTDGGAAPFVLAFCTAEGRAGGDGALLVRLALR